MVPKKRQLLIGQHFIRSNKTEPCHGCVYSIPPLNSPHTRTYIHYTYIHTLYIIHTYILLLLQFTIHIYICTTHTHTPPCKYIQNQCINTQFVFGYTLSFDRSSPILAWPNRPPWWISWPRDLPSPTLSCGFISGSAIIVSASLSFLRIPRALPRGLFLW